jgi:hypothetical protein
MKKKLKYLSFSIHLVKVEYYKRKFTGVNGLIYSKLFTLKNKTTIENFYLIQKDLFLFTKTSLRLFYSILQKTTLKDFILQ